jgi:ribonuclease E
MAAALSNSSSPVLAVPAVKKQRKPRVAKEDKPEKRTRAPSAYNYYVKEFIFDFKASAGTGDEIPPPKEMISMAAASWKTLSDEEKADFKAKHCAPVEKKEEAEEKPKKEKKAKVEAEKPKKEKKAKKVEPEPEKEESEAEPEPEKEESEAEPEKEESEAEPEPEPMPVPEKKEKKSKKSKKAKQVVDNE